MRTRHSPPLPGSRLIGAFPGVAILALVAPLLLAGCGHGTIGSLSDAAALDAASDGGNDAASDGGNDAASDGGNDAAEPPADAAGPECGDGVVDPGLGEVCDDGNTNDGDGCRGDCARAMHVVPLGISGQAYDLARDNTGAVHLLWKSGGTLHYGRIENEAVVGREEIPNSTQVNIRFDRPRLAVRPDGATVHTC